MTVSDDIRTRLNEVIVLLSPIARSFGNLDKGETPLGGAQDRNQPHRLATLRAPARAHKLVPTAATRAAEYSGRRFPHPASPFFPLSYGMPPAYDFKLALTRVIEPTGGSWRRQRRRHASSAAL